MACIVNLVMHGDATSVCDKCELLERHWCGRGEEGQSGQPWKQIFVFRKKCLFNWKCSM